MSKPWPPPGLSKLMNDELMKPTKFKHLVKPAPKVATVDAPPPGFIDLEFIKTEGVHIGSIKGLGQWSGYAIETNNPNANSLKGGTIIFIPNVTLAKVLEYTKVAYGSEASLPEVRRAIKEGK